MCNSWDQQYIGNTTRFIHDRVNEHLNNENSSVKDHYGRTDPANVRLYEAFLIRMFKPTLNSREECTQLVNLTFYFSI